MSAQAPVHPIAKVRRARTNGFLSIALGLVALMGGGVLAGTAQWLMIELDGLNAMEPGNVPLALASAAPVTVLGGAAVLLSGRATNAEDDTAAVSGRVGLVLGILAMVGAILQAIAILAS